MKIIKGNFSKENKVATIVNQQQEDKNILNEEVPYSMLLVDLITPFLKPSTHPDEFENLLQLGIVAWNMAVLKSVEMPEFKQMFNATLKHAGIIGTQVDIVHQMMKTKNQLYKEHEMFIEDYELTDDENDKTHLSVIVKSMFDFINDSEMEDEDIEAAQYEEGYVNRNALLVKPTAAFWAWIKTYDNEFIDPQAEHRIYLINETESDTETANWVKKNFDRIFIEEVAAWIPNEDYWPKKRTYKMFCNFFDVQYHGIIMDLEKEPLIKD